MANGYSQRFTLAEIFNNKKLKGVIPLVNYKETEREDGKISKTTNMKSVKQLIVDTSTKSARPFYKPLIVRRSQGKVELSGELVGDQDACVDAVYSALLAQRVFMIWTANNMDLIRYALKESEEHKRKTGEELKLFLRQKSMLEIQSMNWRQAQAFLNNVMENIFFSGNYPKTLKKYNIKKMLDDEAKLKGEYMLTYGKRRLSWKFRVGDV